MRLVAPVIALAAALSTLVPSVAGISAITRKGKYLFDSSGDRFYIKGVAYQPQGELAASSTANSAK